MQAVASEGEMIMSMNSTPSGERVHIGFFGRRNAGKSSVVNAVTGQDLAVVSDVKGTTTDPVKKAMELLELFRQKNIPYIVVRNKCDLLAEIPADTDREIWVSALKNEKIFELKERIAALNRDTQPRQLIADKLQTGDLVVLVVPIDKAAPKGRLILPQQQTIRDILEAGAAAVVVRDSELEQTLAALGRAPKLVITDSQVFGTVSKIVPREVPLTSFSILMARYKGLLEDAVKGAAAVENLRDGATVLVAEGCTHHRQCNDIGTVKIPGWLRKYTGKNLNIRACAGTEFPEDLTGINHVVHCGGCMLGEREVLYRMKCAADQGVPITNYGTLIAYLNGILKRSIEIFPELGSVTQ